MTTHPFYLFSAPLRPARLLLADLMQRGDLMEKAGTGITRMREECEAHGTPPPEIADIGHHVAVTFRPHPKASRFYSDM